MVTGKFHFVLVSDTAVHSSDKTYVGMGIY
jgi:hypothetical protein